MPSVAVGVREGEALTYLLQPNTSATLVVFRLGEVAVLTGEDNFAVLLRAEADVDERRSGGADAVLEGVLNE